MQQLAEQVALVRLQLDRRCWGQEITEEGIEWVDGGRIAAVEVVDDEERRRALTRGGPRRP